MMAGEQGEEFEVVIRVRSGIPKKRWAERLYPVIAEIRDLEDALSKLYQLDYSVSSMPARALRASIDERQGELKRRLETLVTHEATVILDIEVR